MKVLQGDCLTVLKELPKESIDTIYTCPSPFRYYEDEETGKLGSEKRLDDYLSNLMEILRKSHDILKPSGSFFLQIPELWNMNGGVLGMPVVVENHIRDRLGMYYLRNRLFWHRTETRKLKYEEKGFLKNYEYIFHLVKDHDRHYFNVKSRFARTSVFSYPLEGSYYTDEFDSGLPSQLSEMIIDTTVPKGGVVLDPLAGSGKFGYIAKRMGRDYIMIDVDPELCQLMKTKRGL